MDGIKRTRLDKFIANAKRETAATTGMGKALWSTFLELAEAMKEELQQRKTITFSCPHTVATYITCELGHQIRACHDCGDTLHMSQAERDAHKAMYDTDE